MPSRRWLAVLSFWPGLPQIWGGQLAIGLLLAVTFSLFLNVALVTTFIWRDWVGLGVVSLAWYATAACWAWALGATIWWLWRRHPEHFHAEIDILLREALQDYLQGRWQQAQARLERVLKLDESDCDALVHLATLYAHAGRTAEAREAFRRCLQLDGGGKWRWEIDEAMTHLAGA
jgi:tetratricopeptide (TPR) repeat protein